MFFSAYMKKQPSDEGSSVPPKSRSLFSAQRSPQVPLFSFDGKSLDVCSDAAAAALILNGNHICKCLNCN